ncbi:transglutaminase [Acinetobacter sp. ANC 5054]|uniref:transglutaminase family protein n=1 Tax=Acinetobacter sp. ANC 5054 TaxID=1977877 RepID=UPI000A3531E1|nr:transglutaminase family protein [Acinetobacter sp. ANC 5054]OTG81931.1 transglutaminase [Acinetobacter sp. ANC 5054]
MRLMVNHQTHYVYSDLVNSSIQYIKMTPSTNSHQCVKHWDVSVPGLREMKLDAFQNVWLTTTQRKPYWQMTIMAQGIVEMDQHQSDGVQDQLNPKLFLQPTQSTLCDSDMKSFADCYVPRVNRANLIHLSEAILQHIPYVPNQTSVHTSAIKAFKDRIGVCQDHSHVMIAMCKYLGVPARYVSGYLYIPQSTHLASHAWVEAFLDNKWYCFDVSNQLFTPQSHIYVAIGRDYWDVAPVRGVREQGGIESMSSIVQVLGC